MVRIEDKISKHLRRCVKNKNKKSTSKAPPLFLVISEGVMMVESSIQRIQQNRKFGEKQMYLCK